MFYLRVLSCSDHLNRRNGGERDRYSSLTDERDQSTEHTALSRFFWRKNPAFPFDHLKMFNAASRVYITLRGGLLPGAISSNPSILAGFNLPFVSAPVSFNLNNLERQRLNFHFHLLSC